MMLANAAVWISAVLLLYLLSAANSANHTARVFAAATWCIVFTAVALAVANGLRDTDSPWQPVVYAALALAGALSIWWAFLTVRRPAAATATPAAEAPAAAPPRSTYVPPRGPVRPTWGRRRYASYTRVPRRPRARS